MHDMPIKYNTTKAKIKFDILFFGYFLFLFLAGVTAV